MWVTMGCNCNKGASASKLSWTVDLTVPAADGKVFADGTKKKTYSLASEANSAIAQLGLTGKIRPTPATT
jgi:hypothetical protein